MIRAIALCMLASPATASPFATWSGPGPDACASRCSLEWAISQLTDAQRHDLATVRVHQPEPVLMTVHDGDYMPLMAYWRDGAAHMDRRGTVAVLDRPEPAVGWNMGDWQLVRIDACQNWAAVQNPPAYETTPITLTKISSTPPRTPVGPIPPYVPPVVPISPVPLPASVWLLLVPLIALTGMKRRVK